MGFKCTCRIRRRRRFFWDSFKMICIDFVTMCNYNHDEKAIMKLHQTNTVCSTYNGTLLVSKAGESYCISINSIWSKLLGWNRSYGRFMENRSKGRFIDFPIWLNASPIEFPNSRIRALYPNEAFSRALCLICNGTIDRGISLM